MLTIIIGKNSNLSKELSQNIENIILVTSLDVINELNGISIPKEEKVNIIFNNFQTAIKLNSIENPIEYIERSIGVTVKVLDFIKHNSWDINKIIYTSSSSVYGNNILCHEQDELKPLNLHASLKISNEKLIEKFCIENNIDYTITRIFNMYGGDDKFSIISKIINSYKNSELLTIVNNGNSIRDFIHIYDVVMIYKLLLEVKNIKIINIGTGKGTSVRNIIDFLKNRNIILRTTTIRREELKISTADVQQLIKIYNQQFIHVEEYIKDTLIDFINNRK